MFGTAKINTFGVSGSTLTVHYENRVGINTENPVETLDVAGAVQAQSYKSLGKTGVTQDVAVVTDIQIVGGIIQKKTKIISYTNGIVTNVGAESGWV